MSQELRDMLLQAPDSQLDKSAHPLIEKWSTPVKAIELLEVLDHCVYSALASGLILNTLSALMHKAMVDETITSEELEKQATWRT